MKDPSKIADRLRVQMHLHPRLQYLRLTRAEAEAIVAYIEEGQ